MNLVMKHDANDDDAHDDNAYGGNAFGGNGGKYECDNCRMEFPNKTSMERHTLFCRTLAEIRRGGGGGGGGGGAAGVSTDDPLMPTPREMFVLIQELAAKYNKVRDELDVMKQWAKMVGRRIGGSNGGGGAGGGAGSAAGLDFTSITRQKRQNIEVILNEEDAEHPELAEARPGFAEWLTSSSSSSLTVTETELHVVFNEDLVAGITAAILRVLAGYTVESGRSHLAPFKLSDIKQGTFYIFDTAFKVAATAPAEIGLDPPTRRKWRAIEPCEFQLMVRTFHKLLFKEFKKWQDLNWEAQRELTKQRQKAATSYQQMFQCSPAMASCDGMYPMPPSVAGTGAGAAGEAEAEDEPAVVGGAALSEDFATLYNKYADKMMGGALSDEAIVTKVRAKLWKDMKAWRL